MRQPRYVFLQLLVALALLVGIPAEAMAQQQPAAEDDGFEQNEIVQKAGEFFGATTEGLAKAIEKVFSEQGKPNAYVTGEEISGAVGIGVIYGEGDLNRKSGAPTKVYWQGPSIGFDFGGNASKVMVLIYHLPDTETLFQRFPAVDGSLYVVAGVGVNYQQSGDIILAPIRTGVGLRAGVNIGYMHYTKTHSWIPL